MIFVYENNSKSSGIYVLQNLATNRFYIGQSKEFKERWKYHAAVLTAGKHSNPFLQNDYNKCKNSQEHDDFIQFSILELMPNSTREERNEREEEWITTYKNNNYSLYNVDLKPTKRGKIHSHNPELTKQRKSEAVTGAKNPFYGKKHSEETRKKMSENHADFKGKNSPCFAKTPSPEKLLQMKRTQFKKGDTSLFKGQEGLKGMKNGHAKILTNVRLLSPDGILYTHIECLSEFAREHGLEQTNLLSVIRGRRRSCRGWTIEKQ